LPGISKSPRIEVFFAVWIMKKLLTLIGTGFLLLLAAGVSLWVFGALIYDGPGFWFAASAGICLLAAMILLKFRWRAWAAWGVCISVAIGWWLTLQAPAEAKWQADVARVASAEINGDVVTFHNVRDFQYRSETEFTPRWTTREVRLSSLIGVDIAVNYWGSPWMAHPILSFRFSDAPPLAFSIETRKRAGQSYSAIGGLYRQFPLICIVAEERDVLALRAAHRENEDVYLYHTTLTPESARKRLLEYITTVNSLARKPRWYNAITTNCTTGIRSQNVHGDRLPLDWRILVNGKGDEMMFERGVLDNRGLPFPRLKQLAHANTAIKAAEGAIDFSSRIREDLYQTNR
jgi:hypothetical protein